MRYGSSGALAICSGVLLAISFPRAGHPAFAWVSLAPLFLALTGPIVAGRPIGQPPLRAFLLGLVAGAVYFAGTLHWTATVGATFGQMPAPLAAGATLLLVAYLALFPALASLATSELVRRWGARGLLLAPAPWVGTEYLRGLLFGGFPWVPLGSSQVSVLPVAQLASLTGVYGVSALVAFVSATLVWVSFASRRQGLRALAAMAALLAIVAGWGAWRIGEGTLTREGTALRVGLVQANIAQQEKWDPREARRILTTHISLSREVADHGADLILWPESSVPFRLGSDAALDARLRALARELRVPLLVGSDQHHPLDASRLYNAAFLIGTDGEDAAVYRKRQLVPFGEVVPFGRLLSFVSPLVAVDGTYVPGEAMTLLPVAGHLVSTAICYEAVYPWLARQAVASGSALLTTITNDAWYGDSSAPYQHFALASMRAIEQGRYLARAANTGISGIVDPYGRVVRTAALFEPAGLVEEVRLLSRRTVYSVTGDVVAHLALLVTALGLAAGRRRW